MQPLKLFMILLGATPPGRHTEQHDLFFGIGHELKDLLPDIYKFWPEAKKQIHIDAWREVTFADGYEVKVLLREDEPAQQGSDARLFFINLGGYKQNEFEEYHYKVLAACGDKGIAIQQAKQTAFYKHTGFKGAASHIDDKYGVDVDDIYEIEDILPPPVKEKYRIVLSPAKDEKKDALHLGYLKLEKLK